MKIRFLGAARRVTGSCYHLLDGDMQILVDCGMNQGRDSDEINSKAFQFVPGQIQYLLLTHAHLDHAGGCADLLAPVTLHERETRAAYWVLIGGLLDLLPQELLTGDGGSITPGLDWARTPGHCDGHISLRVDTSDGPVAICGDTIGPSRAAFDAMRPDDGPGAAELLASWRLIRSWRPARIVAGHLPPFKP